MRTKSISVKTMICFGVCLSLLPVIRGMILTQGESHKDEIEMTHDVRIEIDGRRVDSTFIAGRHAPRVTLTIPFKGTVHSIDLVLNVYMLHSSYKEKVLYENETILRSSNSLEDMCYYKGEVRNKTQSRAAFSTCNGIKGFFYLANTTFSVSPVNSSADLSSRLYEIKKVKEDNIFEWICGTKDIEERLTKMISDKSGENRQIVSESLDGKYVVELYIATDRLMLDYHKGDTNEVVRVAKEIVNVANLLYQPVGFTLVLVGLEVWHFDQIQVTSNSSTTIARWYDYRNRHILPQHYNDAGYLISKMNFNGNVVGLARLESMCSSQSSGGIMTAFQNNAAVSGAILSHELGHNFGLSHDTDGCSCESANVSCIMSPVVSNFKPSTYFSSCSKSQLKTSISQGFDLCLKDLPITSNYHYSICGNGILENGEECDCGRLPHQECNRMCCDASTCKLAGTAKCASGKCCDISACQPRQSGFLCRSSAGSCDLSEFCDGSSAFCPKNVFKHDGMNCSLDEVNSYCWNGQCRTRDSQCKKLYGTSGRESDRTCYSAYNTRGDEVGNCGFTTFGSINYTACLQQDVMCGTLKCEAQSNELLTYTNFLSKSYTNGNRKCYGVLLDYGNRVENPGMVPNGASCGAHKMCISQKCVDVSPVLNNNSCPLCQNGICSNEGNCQCYPGFGGPDCSQPNQPDKTTEFPKPTNGTITTTKSTTSNAIITKFTNSITITTKSTTLATVITKSTRQTAATTSNMWDARSSSTIGTKNPLAGSTLTHILPITSTLRYLGISTFFSNSKGFSNSIYPGVSKGTSYQPATSFIRWDQPRGTSYI